MNQYKARELVRLLGEAGFVEKSICGDHHKFVKQGNRPIIVPYARLGDTLHVGTYRAIIRQLNKSKQ
ncbi:MAG: type II toxin-antitoxin system HicA family toxin [Lactobacillus sp.]|jgi:predicted RNA binding protein YcfA (HicA-like mRNA interferase family)|nr:type II toxin-antitoxin system HicA family toxin [Lactobacillus sp.]MCH3906378.1 type II toxin-antitoxin system HicA family toxin [Lactobacillus sp.]MCH3990047.1 type II toxin-antitoxin system HicA family toxin [Lactobacillus sp.]MCH4069239.1 type II toxin-antitoxin system HicA family toxin [Lactobacillus sp.]MCI1303541.1 type II toxin-antitoxin system HicA family toxin [Lactobacillus sp.]